MGGWVLSTVFPSFLPYEGKTLDLVIRTLQSGMDNLPMDKEYGNTCKHLQVWAPPSCTPRNNHPDGGSRYKS